MLVAYQSVFPQVAEDVFIAPGVVVIGQVTLKKGANIWYNTVLRGDVDKITIGEYTNIQDGCTIHCEHNAPTVIGNYVTVGHNAVLHSCQVDDCCLIGMGAIVLDNAKVGYGSIIGAGAVVTKGTIIPPNSLVLGCPAKVVKGLPANQGEENKKNADFYYELSNEYQQK